MSIIDKMIEFNKLIDLNIKSEKFYNDDNVSNEKKALFNEKYINLVQDINKLKEEIEDLGYTFKDKDLIYGIGRW